MEQWPVVGLKLGVQPNTNAQVQNSNAQQSVKLACAWSHVSEFTAQR